MPLHTTTYHYIPICTTHFMYNLCTFNVTYVFMYHQIRANMYKIWHDICSLYVSIMYHYVSNPAQDRLPNPAQDRLPAQGPKIGCHTNTYQYIPLGPIHTNTYWCINTYQYMHKRTNAYHSHTNAHQYITLCVSTCHYIPIHANTYQYVQPWPKYMPKWGCHIGMYWNVLNAYMYKYIPYMYYYVPIYWPEYMPKQGCHIGMYLYVL